jgi:hypothetical protein
MKILVVPKHHAMEIWGGGGACETSSILHTGAESQWSASCSICLLMGIFQSPLDRNLYYNCITVAFLLSFAIIAVVHFERNS